jgi:hypothetical protein
MTVHEETPTTLTTDDVLVDTVASGEEAQMLSDTTAVADIATTPDEADLAATTTTNDSGVPDDAPVAEVDRGPHPTIAVRIIFDGNAFDIPSGTPEIILKDNNALRRAYAMSMGMPELTQAQMDEGTDKVDGYQVRTLTLRIRPQVKGASHDAPSLLALLRHVSRLPSHSRIPHHALVHMLRGRPLTVGQAVRLDLADLCDNASEPSSTRTSGGTSLCSLLDLIPSDAEAAPADAV